MSTPRTSAARVRLSVAAAAVAVAAVPALSAAASTTVTPGGGARSTLTLVSVTAAGHTVHALTASLGADSLASPSTASVTVSPLTGTGADPAPITYTQDTTQQPNVAAQSFGLPGVLSVTSPSAAVSAARTATGAVARLAATVAGADGSALSVLGLPVPGTVSVQNSSDVSNTLAVAGKELSVSNLSLPSVGDLLGALGLDLTKLPASTVSDLTSQLNLVPATITSAVATLNSQIDAAQQAVDDQRAKLATLTAQLSDAQAAAATAQSALDAANATLASATTALDTAVSDINTALSALSPVALTPLTSLGLTLPLTAAQISANEATVTSLVGSSLTSAFDTALSNYTSAQAAQAAAQTALDTANATVTTDQGLVNDAQTLLNQLVATLTGLLNQLATYVPQLITALDSTPLASVGLVDVVTQASAGSSHAAVVSGTVKDVHVLGTDVLKTALGSSSVDITTLAGSVAAKVQSAISTVTGVVSSVLSNVPVIPGTPDLSGLTVPAPSIALLTKATSTAPIGGLQAAQARLTTLQVSWPGLTIPSAALTATALAALPSGATSLVSSPLGLTVGALDEIAKFRPGQSATPTGGGSSTPTGGGGSPTASPTLPHTGGSLLLPLVGVVLLGAAYGVRRWRQAAQPVA